MASTQDNNTILGILKGDIALLDVRAEKEFQQGAIPGSKNLPILTDSEREAVGTAYRKQGAQAATELGHQLVHTTERSRRIEAWRDFIQRQPNAKLTCWRGGQRSAIAQTWLDDAGVSIERVDGGYKHLRQVAMQLIARGRVCS